MKIAGLDAYEVNILFYFNFVGEGFEKAFDDSYKDIVDFKYRRICEGARLLLTFDRGDL